MEKMKQICRLSQIYWGLDFFLHLVNLVLWENKLDLCVWKNKIPILIYLVSAVSKWAYLTGANV